MAKLVLLSAGHTGRTHDLQVDKTTVGRVEDNTLQIAEPSVSSHHCEILLRGADVVVKDLDSTNGTFINGEKISESV
ncbi:MAG TPA: FHA domain-containing protein, partial [Verrucomicrobiae bacterium]|nr:FHA domain-containing protein [Verrucomicrobiae bacterium]